MSKDEYVVGFKWLAVYEMAGGLLGIASIVPLILRTNDLNFASALLIFGGFLLQSFLVYFGLMLF
jgi:hypothetical protein